MRFRTFCFRTAALCLSIVLFVAVAIPFSLAAGQRDGRVVNAPTPIGPGVEKYVRSFGTDYANAPTSPILAEDTLIIFSGRKLYKLDKETGEEIASVKAEGRITFTTVSPLYHDGQIYMQLDDGIVQAFDFVTMRSLWIYHDPIGGQALCPIRYDDGAIYTGFWDGETREANYVCLTVEDPDPAAELEEKTALWTYPMPGGFYRTGCSFSDKYILFGCDDGERGSQGSSCVTALDKKTGAFASSLALFGDIRTDVVYDAQNDAFYTASKSGFVYRFLLEGSTGRLFGLTVYEAPGAVTSAPAIYKNRLYLGAQNGTGGKFLVLDAGSLNEIWADDLPGYPQAGMLISNGYESETGKVYIYTTYNMKPGGVYVFEDSAGQTAPVKREVYAPPQSASQYCISPIVADGNGTLYYKNDSGNIFAVSPDPEVRVPEAVARFLRETIVRLKQIFALLRSLLITF